MQSSRPGNEPHNERRAVAPLPPEPKGAPHVVCPGF